jgi:hypothetical protein
MIRMMQVPLSGDFLYRKVKARSWRNPEEWARLNGVHLRPYQVEVVCAIVDSVVNKRGLTFVVVLPRQSGKNELQAHLLAWMMFRFSRKGARMVSVSPTFKPQTINSMDRVRASLDRNSVTMGNWRASSGFVYKYGQSRLQFFSADPSAKVVGATADMVLSVDEAQDVAINKFDKDFDPMTASTNATRVFWGTVWTADTLLARQMRQAKQEQERDGIKRLFIYSAEDVRKLVPEYGLHVDRVVAEKGRQHPLVKTQYFCEEIDAQASMFHPGRRALMLGDEPARETPGGAGLPYAFLLDVAGQDEASLNLDGLGNPGRDSTTLSIVAVDLSTLATLQAPTYRVVKRVAWTGLNHLDVFGQIKAMADLWRPMYLAVDATGVGEGMWALLDKSYPGKVLPVKFSQQVKSEIGWKFLAIIETGRFRDCCSTAEVDEQYLKCQSEILPGPAKTLRWGVKDGTRGAEGRLVHDDFVLADALCAVLDDLKWLISSETVMIHPVDPLKAMDRNF